MPQVEISIGGRSFEVACQAGEEAFLQSAAAMLDGEASHLADQMGRMPEARMLLMAGLMLADKTVGLDAKLNKAQTEVEALRSELKTLRSQPAPVPERVEVPVVPAAVKDALAEIAARAEALADQVDGQA
ncbi:cell division protein ZapA [Yoonia maritima]|uniref:Cell division protein ZapA n=1 Tax=Yoonia maritima TaxID=1435347 RepID=A0A2T0W1M5_9RHOB|nr:cell division protein ZapA [Yoonia maritima]PRY78843.1 cell division protein ZapA [Yoonia maritima]